jgi:indole-3-glycerol phosphate synthase
MNKKLIMMTATVMKKMKGTSSAAKAVISTLTTPHQFHTHTAYIAQMEPSMNLSLSGIDGLICTIVKTANTAKED